MSQTRRVSLLGVVLGLMVFVSRTAPSLAADMKELKSLDQLREQFTQDEDITKIVLLLSPT